MENGKLKKCVPEYWKIDWHDKIRKNMKTLKNETYEKHLKKKTHVTTWKMQEPYMKTWKITMKNTEQDTKAKKKHIEKAKTQI